MYTYYSADGGGYAKGVAEMLRQAVNHFDILLNLITLMFFFFSSSILYFGLE